MINFDELLVEAKRAAVGFHVNDDCHVGSVGAAILTVDGVIYNGACIDVSCSMGFCAEHAAIASMLKDRKTQIIAVVAVTSGGMIIPPCGRCRELMDQIDRKNRSAEIMIGNDQVVRLSDLLPFPCQDARRPQSI
jgi:cytidine deaminase